MENAKLKTVLIHRSGERGTEGKEKEEKKTRGRREEGGGRKKEEGGRRDRRTHQLCQNNWTQ